MDNGSVCYRLYLDGDENAFAEIEKMYFEHLVLFINRYVNDLGAAEDIAIDALAELIIHPKRFRFDTPLKTYLFAIGRNMAVNHLKRRRITDELPENGASDDETPIEAIIKEEQKLALHRAIDRLPDDMKIVIHLVYFEELSCDDAARIMKKTRKQVYNLLYRAKEELRSLLGKEGAF